MAPETPGIPLLQFSHCFGRRQLAHPATFLVGATESRLISFGTPGAPTALMLTNLAAVEPITNTIIGCAIEVHRIFGPGLLESVYRECLVAEIKSRHLCVTSDCHVPLHYKGQRLGAGFSIDLLVEDCVVVELKAVEALHPVHLAQVITYLKLTGYPAGLLLNFNVPSLRAGLRRLYHPDHYIHRVPGSEA